ncbi:MAG: hypothetical protein U0835_26600 [Isosphaeraceae bacterium]
MDRVCSCEGKAPLASFCLDDLHCPQCGDRVAHLSSQNLQPDPDGSGQALWVYPARARDRSGRLEFRFALAFTSHDDRRRPRDRPLELTSVLCHGQVDSFFERKLDLNADDGKVEFALRPLPSLVESLYKVLPHEGAAGTLSLSGNCGEPELKLRVFNPLTFRFALEGDGAQADPPGTDAPTAWSLGRGGTQELTLRVWPMNGLVHLPEPAEGATHVTVTPDFSDSAFQLDACRHGRVVGPGRPVELHVRFDVDGWDHGDRKSLTIQLFPKVPALPPVAVEFFRQAVGDLRFDPPGELLQLRSALYYGERVESSSGQTTDLVPPVRVWNGGDDILPLRQPEIVSQSLPGVEWLTVRIEGPETGDRLTMELEESRTLSVVIDLRNVTGRPTRRGNLRAELEFRHVEYGRTWALQVLVPEVRTRPVLRSPLAVDFGNTNTYAATVDLLPSGDLRRARPASTRRRSPRRCTSPTSPTRTRPASRWGSRPCGGATRTGGSS